uniref:ATP-binding protein n=1 Tax=Devosia sp. TaxID=1871048 RepID=UPI0035B4EDA7
VANDGRPVPPETLARLAQPFARGDTTARGTGLGLSIVQTIMDQTGGKLELFSPAPGSTAGFLAVLRLA